MNRTSEEHEEIVELGDFVLDMLGCVRGCFMVQGSSNDPIYYKKYNILTLVSFQQNIKFAEPPPRQ